MSDVAQLVIEHDEGDLRVLRNAGDSEVTITGWRDPSGYSVSFRSPEPPFASIARGEHIHILPGRSANLLLRHVSGRPSNELLLDIEGFDGPQVVNF